MAKMRQEEEQYLIEVFADYYSQEDIFSIGRWMGIDPSRYYGFGMNGIQLAQAFLTLVKNRGLEDNMFRVIASHPDLYRDKLRKYLPVPGANEIRFGKELHAILVGVNEYDMENGMHNLSCPVNDVNAFSAFLQDYWDVSRSNIHMLTEGEANTCDYILSVLESVCESLDEEDNLLFYFSGHGMELDGHSYLLPSDTHCEKGYMFSNLIPLSEVNRIIKECRAGVKVRIFDACQCGERFSKAIKSGVEPETEVTEQMSELMMEEFMGSGTDWITFCSCNVDEYSYEIPSLGHGIFTYMMLEGLKGGAKYGMKKMQIEDLKQYVCENVPKIAAEHMGVSQHPQYQCEVQYNIVME
ncbi:MAG: caspase family protein [Clostridiales bacterium]|nr:caspase family protein [Candidatus Blautia equi]